MASLTSSTVMGKGQVFFIDGLLEIRVVRAMGRGGTKLFEVGGPSLKEGISLKGGNLAMHNDRHS